jgi:Protein of unknown function (DUF2786)
VSRTTSPQPFTVADQVAAVASLVGRRRDAVAAAGLRRLAELDAAEPGRVERELWQQLDHQLGLAWSRGWQPAELADYVRRVEGPAGPLLRGAIASEHKRYAPATIDPRWQAQLDQLDADSPTKHPRSRLDQVAARHGTTRNAALVTAVAVLGTVMTLPALQRLLPMPGRGVAAPADRLAGADQKVLSRVRALLAKAEGTDFPDEADALSAKAQALMAKFSLDRAMVDATANGEPPAGPAARRVWLQAPYVSAKSHLVDAVAQANGCRAVTATALRVVTILGEDADLQLVELLVTSLLVQATREMLRAGGQRSAAGGSSTRSYRHAFLISYAVRIGERLRAAVHDARVAVVDEQRLLPVLARRDEQVDALVTDLFPHTVAKQVSVSNRAGWAHGRAAADLATLDTRRPVSGG